MDIKSFKQFLATGEHIMDTMDAAPDVTLENHDKRFHPEGFKEGDTCKFRENLAKGDETDTNIEGGAETQTISDLDKMMEIRDRLEPIARLLNGRHGNQTGLQASRRWQDLQDYSDNGGQGVSDIQSLDGIIANNKDANIVGAASDLKTVAENINKSRANNWNDPAGFVISQADLKKLDAPAVGSFAPIGNTPSSIDYIQLAASRDDIEAVARLINGRTGNIPALQASRRWPRLESVVKEFNTNGPVRRILESYTKMADKDFANAAQHLLDVGMEIAASANNNFNTPVSQVMSANDLPKDPSLAQAPTPSPAPSVPATTPKATGSLKPFQAPSAYQTVLDGVNATCPAATDPDYWKNKSDAMTVQQAIADMEQKGFIEKGGFKDAYDSSDPDDNALWGGWKPKKKDADFIAKVAAVCFDDIKTRFPNMQWPSALSVRCGSRGSTGGQAVHSDDDSRHAILLSASLLETPWASCGLGKGNYGHNDARFGYDVLRHELGHAIMSGDLGGKRKMSLFHDAVTKAYGNPCTELIDYARNYISDYAVTEKRIGQPSMSEMMAEMFAVATSPDYKPGYLPAPIEEFIFSEMLGVKLP